MSERMRQLGIDPSRMVFPEIVRTEEIDAYRVSFKALYEERIGQYLPSHMKEAVQDGNFFDLVAETTWEVATLLGIETFPRLGLLNGLLLGFMNYEGFCWEEDSDIWVGFEELWLMDMMDADLRWGDDLSTGTKYHLRRVLAEEVAHAYVRETLPDLAEQSIQVNLSGDKGAYRANVVECGVKEFAEWYALQKLLQDNVPLQDE